MVETYTVDKLKTGDLFQFRSGQRINRVYFIESKEVFYINILSKLNRKIKINANPLREVILLTPMFNKEVEDLAFKKDCPF